MKTLKLMLLFLLVITGTFLRAQDTASKPLKKMVVHDFFVFPGFVSMSNNYGTLADFRKLAPQSELLKSDLTGYNQLTDFIFHTNTMFSAMMGIQLLNDDKKSYKPNPLLRIGLSYFSATALSARYSREDTKRYDTLTSKQTGQITYADSVTTRNYDMNYSSEQIRLDLSLIYRTDPSARWSMYAGFGITAGVSLNAKTQINYSIYEESGEDDVDYPYYTSGNGPGPFSGVYNYYTDYYYADYYKNETFINKNNLAFSGYIPLGVDFRMGKKREFWKRIHLFYECRPGINITSVPELGTISSGSIQQGIGIRMSWQ